MDGRLLLALVLIWAVYRLVCWAHDRAEARSHNLATGAAGATNHEIRRQS